jgi:imidazolonepropionase-like amidohydrolase
VVTTLKAGGLLNVGTGEIVRPGVLRVEDDRITGVGGVPEREVVDLGDAIPLPGLMDMEVNLLMGGRGENPSPVPLDRGGADRVERAHSADDEIVIH